MLPPSLKLNYTPGEIFVRAEKLVQQLHHGIDELLKSVTTRDSTFENTVVPIGHIFNELDEGLAPIQLLESVSPLADIVYQSEGVFELIDSVKQARPRHLDEEAERLLSVLHEQCIDHGLKLPAEKRNSLAKLTRRCSELTADFIKNLGLDPGSLWFYEDELNGLSKATLGGLDSNDLGQRCVHLYRTTATVVLRQCKVEKTRRRIFAAREQLYFENVALFKNIVLIRDESARMLGYSSYHQQLVHRRMMKSPQAVMTFLDDIGRQLQPLVAKELETMQELSSNGNPIHLWDFPFYHEKMLLDRYVEKDLAAEYFPTDFVLPRISDVEVWHEDVKVFRVVDLVDQTFVGFLYTDLYPRVGKYNHAANFPVRPSYTDRHDAPSLLQHSDVVTIFHELGHGMHDLMGRTKYAMFHGWRGRRDFIEAPSQLLEFWCWLPETLKSMSCHYSHLSKQYRGQWKRQNPEAANMPEEKIPNAFVTALVAAKMLNVGLSTARQVGLALFDMKVYNPASHKELEDLDIAKEYYACISKISGLQGLEDGSVKGHGYCTTPHFVYGQEANYYSYTSTRMLAADIWRTCFVKDPLSAQAGLRYRQMVLDKGGSMDEKEMLTAYLGREPNLDAFLESIGILNAVV
ncbi:hypothetical protein LMH87_009439 [Akanthomyces muscarius]|uniref:Peptidase M3A/M3B catalytic domain-containing protein n=1 Tax=Akanthomyces muscarius TaxID=2231603 RepID=A0A9W8UM89_AKAMU|nr:hypothetical protein LMH87_009439 [Akanthomyces muscarius]KAJ4152921.1 hypothetical protein LMH87_009439 [Akanthomyces muscarius]